MRASRGAAVSMETKRAGQRWSARFARRHSRAYILRMSLSDADTRRCERCGRALAPDERACEGCSLAEVMGKTRSRRWGLAPIVFGVIAATVEMAVVLWLLFARR